MGTEDPTDLDDGEHAQDPTVLRRKHLLGDVEYVDASHSPTRQLSMLCPCFSCCLL